MKITQKIIKTEYTDFLRKKIGSLNAEQTWVVNNMLFMCRAGSWLYGINRPDSDEDIRGVTLAPKSFWVGAKTFEQFESKYPEKNAEFVVYDFRKWLRLTADTNPNVLELLYVEPDNPNILVWSEEWEWIRYNAKKLINQRAYVGFHGYSSSQLKKMVIKQSNKTGRQYITEQFGFDLKFASHGFRLLRQGVEILTKNHITFPRPDADWLKAVREGRVYGPNDMDKCIRDWEEEQKTLEEALKNTVLPPKADFRLHNALLEDVFDRQVNTN